MYVCTWTISYAMMLINKYTLHCKTHRCVYIWICEQTIFRKLQKLTDTQQLWEGTAWHVMRSTKTGGCNSYLFFLFLLLQTLIQLNFPRGPFFCVFEWIAVNWGVKWTSRRWQAVTLLVFIALGLSCHDCPSWTNKLINYFRCWCIFSCLFTLTYAYECDINLS